MDTTNKNQQDRENRENIKDLDTTINNIPQNTTNENAVHEVFAAIDELQAKRDDLAVQKQALQDKVAEEAQKLDQTQQDIMKRKQQLQDYKNALKDIEKQEKQINTTTTAAIDAGHTFNISSDNGQVPSPLWDEMVAFMKTPSFLLGCILINFLLLLGAFAIIGKMQHRMMKDILIMPSMPSTQRSVHLEQMYGGRGWNNERTNNVGLEYNARRAENTIYYMPTQTTNTSRAQNTSTIEAQMESRMQQLQNSMQTQSAQQAQSTQSSTQRRGVPAQTNSDNSNARAIQYFVVPN